MMFSVSFSSLLSLFSFFFFLFFFFFSLFFLLLLDLSAATRDNNCRSLVKLRCDFIAFTPRLNYATSSSEHRAS